MNTFDGNIDKAIAYYSNEIIKLQIVNSKLSRQLRSSLEEKKQLADMITSIEEGERDDTEDKKKRVRRCANEI